jgi:chorismate dehydratase
VQTKIRVGAVSYLNTKPLIYGFQQGMMKDEVDLVIDYPSKIASMLLANTIDVGLVPVAIIPEMKEYYIMSDYCIGCDGEVASVCLFSEVPLEKIETVLLDYQSRTSVDLLKILIKDYWKINVVFEETSGDYQSEISGTTAALVIGDRALKQRKISRFIYDLGAEWKKYTGLPFVFATWISNKKFDKEFVDRFNEANAFGQKKVNDVIRDNDNNIFDLAKYYSHYINFELNEKKEEALNLFLNKIRYKVEIVSSKLFKF